MSKRLNNTLFYLSILACLILLILLFRLIKLYNIICIILDLFTPIFFGYVIAWMLNPVYKRLNKKIDKRLSFAILIILTILFYSLIVLIFYPIFTNEIGNFLELIKNYIDKLKDIPLFKIDESSLEIKPEYILDSCGGIMNIITNFIFVNLFGFYILYNYELINSLLKKSIPNKYKEIFIKFTKKLSTCMYQYVKGTLLDLFILFLIALILFMIFGLKYAALLALLIAITNLIPFIGPYIGGIPAVLVGLSVSSKLGIIAFGIVVFCQIVESNLVSPLIMSKCVKINPLLIIVAITVMGKILGIIGMAFAIPILIFLKILIEFIPKYKKLTA